MSPSRAKRKRKADQVDLHVGRRLRLRRLVLGMSQRQLGDAVGLIYQQIQKYERGVDRVSASGLYRFARILNVPVGYFFKGLPHDVGDGGKAAARDGADDHMLQQRETLELIRAYHGIAGRKRRREVYELIRSLAGPAPT
jgi:transcriptional regulator with XRE-family HTH domain